MTVGVLSGAHVVNHMVVLPPMFGVLAEAFDVGLAALGAAMGVRALLDSPSILAMAAFAFLTVIANWGVVSYVVVLLIGWLIDAGDLRSAFMFSRGRRARRRVPDDRDHAAVRRPGRPAVVVGCRLIGSFVSVFEVDRTPSCGRS